MRFRQKVFGNVAFFNHGTQSQRKTLNKLFFIGNRTGHFARECRAKQFGGPGGGGRFGELKVISDLRAYSNVGL